MSPLLSLATTSLINDPLPIFAQAPDTYDPLALQPLRSPSVVRHSSPRRSRCSRDYPPIKPEASRLGLFATGASTPPHPLFPSVRKSGDATWALIRDKLQDLAGTCLRSPNRHSVHAVPPAPQPSSSEDEGASSAYFRSRSPAGHTGFLPLYESSPAPSELWTEIDLARDEDSSSPFSILSNLPPLSPPIMSTSQPNHGTQFRRPVSRRSSLVEEVNVAENPHEDTLGLRVGSRKVARKQWPDATSPGPSLSPSIPTPTPSCLSERLQRLAPPPLLLLSPSLPPRTLTSDSGVVLNSLSLTHSDTQHPVTALYFPPSAHASSPLVFDQDPFGAGPSVPLRSSRGAAHGPASPTTQLAEGMRGLGLYVGQSPPPLRRAGVLPLPASPPPMYSALRPIHGLTLGGVTDAEDEPPMSPFEMAMRPVHGLVLGGDITVEDEPLDWPFGDMMEMEMAAGPSDAGEVHNPLVFDGQHEGMLSPLALRFGYSARMNDLEGRAASCIEVVEWIRQSLGTCAFISGDELELLCRSLKDALSFIRSLVRNAPERIDLIGEEHGPAWQDKYDELLHSLARNIDYFYLLANGLGRRPPRIHHVAAVWEKVWCFLSKFESIGQDLETFHEHVYLLTLRSELRAAKAVAQQELDTERTRRAAQKAAALQARTRRKELRAAIRRAEVARVMRPRRRATVVPRLP